MGVCGASVAAADVTVPSVFGCGSIAWAKDSVIASRFSDNTLDKLATFRLPWGQPDDLYYPAWMEGLWSVRAKLTNYAAPLGLKYVSSGGSNVDMAKQSLAEQQSRLGVPVDYRLRYVKTKRQHIVEDRIYNLAAREDAYAGRNVTKRVVYADSPGSTREDAIKRGDGPDDPLLAALLYSKLGVQKILVTRFQTEEDSEDVWRSSQATRTLLAQGRMNPIAVDEEILTEYTRLSDGNVAGRIRLLGFLNPNDPMFFEAGSKAVTIADYALQLTPVP